MLKGKINLSESSRGMWVTYNWSNPWGSSKFIKAGGKTNPRRDCDGYWLPETQKLMVRILGVWVPYRNFAKSYADAGGRWYKIRDWSIKAKAKVVPK